jgi:hypothetical protein
MYKILKGKNMKATIEKISSEIEALKLGAERLKAMSDDLPALNRNLVRVLASIKMLELNFVEPFQK